VSKQTYIICVYSYDSNLFNPVKVISFLYSFRIYGDKLVILLLFFVILKSKQYF